MYKRFDEFGISREILSSLHEMGFTEPTDIQKIGIPPIMQGHDIIGIAQTGTGKTASFGIPIVEKGIRGRRNSPGALVLVPTRELAVQVSEELNRIGKHRGMSSLPVYGGQSIVTQIKELQRGADVVVGTPGRVIDHIKRKTLVLSGVSTVVLDEADEMLNMGFIEDMKTILGQTPEQRQTLLFSATMPEEIIRISKSYMTSPHKVRVDGAGSVVASINQVFYEVKEADKVKALTRLLDIQGPALTLIFCHTKRDVDNLSEKLRQMDYKAGAIHGDFSQAVRDEMMGKFRKGSIEILVATDVAARGLDIHNVTLVINFGVPQTRDAYVHRIGRTGRAGKSGTAITLVTPRERAQLRHIERSLGKTISRGVLPSLAEVKKAKDRRISEDLETIIREGKHKGFSRLASELCATFTPEELVAAVLSKVVRNVDDGQPDELISPPRSAGASRETRLFLTVGKRDGIKVPELVRMVSQKSKIPPKSIGNIALFDEYTFVEVPLDLAPRVLASMDGITIGGRKVRVRVANDTERPARKSTAAWTKGTRRTSREGTATKPPGKRRTQPVERGPRTGRKNRFAGMEW